MNRDFCRTARYIYNRRIIEKFSLVGRDLFLNGCELLHRTNSLLDRSSKLRPNRQSSFFFKMRQFRLINLLVHESGLFEVLLNHKCLCGAMVIHVTVRNLIGSNPTFVKMLEFLFCPIHRIRRSILKKLE